MKLLLSNKLSRYFVLNQTDIDSTLKNLGFLYSSQLFWINCVTFPVWTHSILRIYDSDICSQRWFNFRDFKFEVFIRVLCNNNWMRVNEKIVMDPKYKTCRKLKGLNYILQITKRRDSHSLDCEWRRHTRDKNTRVYDFGGFWRDFLQSETSDVLKAHIKADSLLFVCIFSSSPAVMVPLCTWMD